MAITRANGKSDLYLVADEPETGTMLDGIRQKVFADRYSNKDETGTALEHYPEQMWRRVARSIAAVEETEENRVAVGRALLPGVAGLQVCAWRAHPGGRGHGP